MNDFDLQIQSSASDGKYSPRELVVRAAGLVLKTVAITDHDTVSGITEALGVGEDHGVEVIPGIEISANERGVSVHILGFGIDYKNLELLGALDQAQRTRVDRAKEIVDKLQQAGFQVTYEDVLRYAKGSSIGRPHIAKAVLENSENKKILGEINDVGKFIRSFLVEGKPTYVERENFSAQAAIGTIRRAGGVAVWSHPAISVSGANQLEAVLKKFIDYGIDGVEAFNPAHTEEQVRLLYALAGKYELLRTGGSDFHTDEAGGGRAEGGAELASFLTYGLDVSDIVPKLKEAIARRRQEI